MAEISPLRRRMIEDMTVRNLSLATQQSYLNAVSKFSRYFGHSPGFAHVTARRIAQPPKSGLCHEASALRSPRRAARQLPDQSTTLWVEIFLH